MTVCIQYSRPTSGQNEGEIFGLDVAVTNFLFAYFRHGTPEQFICRPTDLPSFDHFKAMAAAAGHDAETKCVGIDPRHPKLNLGAISCLFRPDPLTADLVWRRQQVAGRGFATCGLVHTMSGDRIAHAVGELCTAPTDGSDALICPSEAIRDAVRALWDIHTEYLNHRFGGKFACPVQTPVIPLGIETEKFIRLTGADKRAAQRLALGVAEDEIVVLFHGRISFATKAHPLPLFLAMEQAAQQAKRKLRLVMYGYFKPQEMEPLFRSLAADTCKSVRVDFVMNNDPRFPDSLWAGADIFISLVENIQESFGLTPVEAMAAGLPAIITDWDGYRGSVRDGVDGFLIPTMTPPVSAGMAIAERYYNHGNYGISLTGAAQSTFVDIARCAEAIATLADDDAKRRAFGASGRDRALATYDWRHIITRYEELWREQATLRQTMELRPALPPNWQAVHPDFPNPWKMFESFPSRTLSPNDALRIALDAPAIDRLLQHDMNFPISELLLPHTMMMQLIDAIRNAGTPRAHDILAPFPVSEHDRLWRCIGWMLKHGVAVLA
jgi:glycosyltransferase involved in cell wall biosynthesis